MFRQQSHIEEIRGVYVPFWIFDASADATIRYKATRVRTWSDSKYNYTETSFYSLLREGGVAFTAIPVDGSKQLDDTLMQSIEPFDVSAAVEFQTAYLAGYLANRYDEKQDECIERANARAAQKHGGSVRFDRDGLRQRDPREHVHSFVERARTLRAFARVVP